jgi:hypothetical protein
VVVAGLRAFSLCFACVEWLWGMNFYVFNNTVKDVVLIEDVGHASLLFVHGGGDVRSAKLACRSYTLVGLSALTPLFSWPGAHPAAAASRPNCRRLCAVTAPQYVADPAVAGTCVPSTASMLREWHSYTLCIALIRPTV